MNLCNVRASRNYKITHKSKYINTSQKWNLLHKNTPQSINHTIKGLEENWKFIKMMKNTQTD